MGGKSISDLILSQFSKYVESDELFEGISALLVSAVREKKGATKIKEILEKNHK